MGAGFDPARVAISEIGSIGLSWVTRGVLLQYVVGQVEGERFIVRQQF